MSPSAWLREVKQRLDRERAERAEPIPRGHAQRLRVCQSRLVEDWRAERFANREYEARWERGVLERGRKQMGSGPRPFTPPARPDGKLNTTDPDARQMKRGRAFIPAYNAQAVTTEQQIVIGAELTTEGVDFEQLEPMIATAERELRRVGVKQRPGVVLADAGYWSNGHIDALRERGMIPIVAPDTSRNRPRKTRLGGPYDYMRRVIATKQAARSTHNDSGWSSPCSRRSKRTMRSSTPAVSCALRAKALAKTDRGEQPEQELPL
jgi:Transposase DDE domain